MSSKLAIFKQFGSICATILLVCSTPAHAQETIRLTNGEWAPFQSESLPNYGPSSELVTRAFEKVGIKVEFGFFPWARAIHLVEKGTWDGSFFWVPTSERREKFNLSDAAYTIREVIFYSRNKPLDVKNLDGFSKLRMGRINSSAFGAQFNDLIESGTIPVTYTEKNESLFRMLALNRVDFVPELYNSGYNAINALEDKDERESLTHHEDFSYAWDYHLMISKNIPKSDYYIEAFNTGLALLKEQGIVQEIMQSVTQPTQK